MTTEAVSVMMGKASTHPEMVSMKNNRYLSPRTVGFMPGKSTLQCFLGCFLRCRFFWGLFPPLGFTCVQVIDTSGHNVFDKIGGYDIWV